MRSSQKLFSAQRGRIDLFYEEAAVHYFAEGTDLLLFKGKVLNNNQSLFFLLIYLLVLAESQSPPRQLEVSSFICRSDTLVCD